MKTKSVKFALRLTVVAVQTVLLGLAASAPAQAEESDDAALLTKPTSTVELGLGDVNHSSYKFGQYNGLEKSGGFLIGNFRLQGGDAYDSGGTSRWNITGDNLGLDTRKLDANFGHQGSFNLNIGSDEIEDYRSDTYQTPFLGVGTGNLTLPSNWVVPVEPQNSAGILGGTPTYSSGLNFRGLGPTAGGSYLLSNGQLYTAASAPAATVAAVNAKIAAQQAADIPDFQKTDLATKRQRYNAGFEVNLTQDWALNGSFIQEKKTGLQELGLVNAWNAENGVILPLPIDYTTDQYNLGVNFQGEKSLFTAKYYGSFFRNGIDGITLADPSAAAPNASAATMGSMPDNHMQQLELLERYNFNAANRVVVDGSYSKNTQNQAYGSPSAIGANNQLAWGLPQSSLHGDVVDEVLNVKFNSHATSKFNWGANYKYDKKDNKTPVNTYIFQDANGASSYKTGAANLATQSPFQGTNLLQSLGYTAAGLPVLPSNINILSNVPYSKTLNQVNLDGDYEVAKGEVVKAGVGAQELHRYCDGSWISCVEAAKTKDKTLNLEWRNNNLDDVSTSVAYGYDARRVSDYNPLAFLAQTPAANVAGIYYANNGPAAGTQLNQSAYAFMLANGITGFPASVPPNTLPAGANPLNAPGLITGGVINKAWYGSGNTNMQLPGFQVYDMDSRNRHTLKTRLDWQATDAFSLSPSADLTKDDYLDASYGLRNAKKWSASLDGTYQFDESLSLNAYWTHEYSQLTSAGNSFSAASLAAPVNGQTGAGTSGNAGCYTDMTALKAGSLNDPCLKWTQTQTDTADTFGLSLKKNGLLDHHLDLSGDLSISVADTGVAFTGGTYSANPFFAELKTLNPALAANVPQDIYIPAGNTPTVKTNLFSVKLKAKYAITTASTVLASYQFQHLKAEDYAYDGLQYGTMTNVLPTNETAPSYNISVITLSWIYAFR